MNAAHCFSSPNRIAILGSGHVGATSVYTLVMRGAAREIVLVDADHGRAEGEAMDPPHAATLARPDRIWAGDYRDAARTAIAVIAAGAASHPGEMRLDLLSRQGNHHNNCGI